MNLERIALMRAEEQCREFRFTDRETTPAAEKKRPGVQLCDRTCVACGSRLGVTNRSGVCSKCQNTRSHRQVMALSTGSVPPRKRRRATAEEIERARQRLAERGLAC